MVPVLPVLVFVLVFVLGSDSCSLITAGLSNCLPGDSIAFRVTPQLTPTYLPLPSRVSTTWLHHLAAQNLLVVAENRTF